MTMVRVLPNRYIALLMTPREASMLEGQLLDPGEFPWQDSETQLLAMGVKMQLHSAVANMVMNELDASINAITQVAFQESEKKEAPAEGTETPVQEEQEEVEPEEEPRPRFAWAKRKPTTQED